MPKLAAVDLFCGVGGLSYGLKEAGIDVRAGVDVDPDCKFAFEENVGATFVKKSVKNLVAESLSAYYPTGSIRILVGCAPCQPFSQYTNYVNKSRRKTTPKNRQWTLLREFKRLIIDLKPEVVSMENVPQLEGYRVYDDFIDGLKQNGYFVSVKQVFCPDYGIPQTRTRLVMLASRLGPIDLIPPTHSKAKYLTVKDAIGDLPKIEAGQQSADDSFHRSRKLDGTNLKRIRHSKPGGTWRDWPEELRLECHKKETGESYASVYGRMKWEEPGPTMTTHCCGLGNGRFGHPEQDRAISLREAALLQTFPRDYSFEPEKQKLSQKVLCKQIGNAVPVRLGEVIGRSIKEHVKKQAAG